MDTLDKYRQIIRTILTAHAEVPYAYGDIQIEPVFDRESDRYLLMIHGRENDRRESRTEDSRGSQKFCRRLRA